MKWIKKNINIILLIIWMIIIFVMSSFNGESSGNQSNFIVKIISEIFSISNVNYLSFIIRKLAHFTEYFILGILVINNFKKINKKIIFGSIIFCMLYAFTDEFHQLFVSGRSGQIIDVLIDSFGSMCGIYGYLLFKNYFLFLKYNIKIS